VEDPLQASQDLERVDTEDGRDILMMDGAASSHAGGEDQVNPRIGKAIERRPLYEGSEIDREELVRVMLQALNDIGYTFVSFTSTSAPSFRLWT
jgi:hypothetical protein